MKERKASNEDSGYYISAWGNENIIRNHIAFFEKKVEKELLFLKKDITSSPNYPNANYPNFAAWIRFNTELVCNSLYWRLFRYEGDWKIISEYRFVDLIKEIQDRINNEISSSSIKMKKGELEEMIKAVNLVLNLRNSFQHGGLPNIMRKLRGGSKEKDFEEMLYPNNYKKTKKIFSYAQDFTEVLPKRKINMGYVSIG